MRRWLRSEEIQKTGHDKQWPTTDTHEQWAELYAWRLCYSYLSEAVPAPPKMGTPEWREQLEEELEEAEVQR